MTDDVKEIEATAEKIPEGKLTNWKKEPSVEDLKTDYTDALSHRISHISDVDSWLNNLNVTGSAKQKKVTGKSSITPKLIRKQAEWRYSSLAEPFLSTPDIFNIDPQTYEDKDSAYQNQLVLNNQLNTQIDKVGFIDEYVRTAVDEGTVIIRTGWEFLEKEVPINEPIYEDVEVTDPNLVAELERQGKSTIVQVPTGKFKKTTKTKTVKNSPTLEVCNYKNVTIDPSCQGDMSKAKFVIYSFQTSKSELNEQPDRYKNVDKINLNTISPLGDPDFSTNDNSDFNFKDDPRKLFIAHEYWGFKDIHNNGTLVPIVATYVGNIMIRMELNPYPDQELPFIIVPYLPVRKSVYGQPDGYLLEDNQKIYGAITRGMLDVMARSANGQVGSRMDALDVTNRAKFNRGEDYQYNPGVTPADVFYMHKYPEIPRSAIEMLGIQNSDAESLTGVKAFSSGISGKSLGDNVGGIKSAMDAATRRELGILRRLASGMKKAGRKIISMNSEFLSEEEVVRVTNEEFVTIRRDDLAGKFDLTLSISTPEADNEKASDLSFMLQTVGPNMPPEFTQMILSEIATLRKMPALAKQIREYKAQPDPIAQEKGMLEIELLRAQIANERAKAIENETDVELKQAKTRKLNSESDQQDLDFLEQESGVKRLHEENMKDLDRKTQLDLKAADSLMSENKPKNSQGYSSFNI